MHQVIATLLAVPTGWLLLVVALLVFVEDALFVGFVVPGETAAILAGAAASLGHASLPVVLAVVAAAAVAGDTVGYLVGRRFGARLLTARPLRKNGPALERARLLLETKGGAAVFLGRFTAFLRAVTPSLAGAARMPYRRFVAWNVMGGLAWTAAAVLVGYFAGASYAAAAQTLSRGSAVLVAAVALCAVVAVLVRRRRSGRRRSPSSQAAVSDGPAERRTRHGATSPAGDHGPPEEHEAPPPPGCAKRRRPTFSPSTASPIQEVL